MEKKSWAIVNSSGNFLANVPGKGYQYSDEVRMKFDEKSHTYETLNFFKKEANNESLFWKEIK